ncbi:hypothetical protein F511_36403 [Dorcoceras hygrometricum]|uniref:Uncharacterized protein n=1 Tax=Dorcoceras hygrometricum TaxID=472368 RepID=A0A2Z7AYI5_9LAMI|nr:hypothetical protein F511_36403 [Dorcoceras hygrometricum]
MSLACGEMVEDLDRAACAVFRRGKRCNSFGLNRFDQETQQRQANDMKSQENKQSQGHNEKSKPPTRIFIKNNRCYIQVRNNRKDQGNHIPA